MESISDPNRYRTAERVSSFHPLPCGAVCRHKARVLRAALQDIGIKGELAILWVKSEYHMIVDIPGMRVFADPSSKELRTYRRYLDEFSVVERAGYYSDLHKYINSTIDSGMDQQIDHALKQIDVRIKAIPKYPVQ